MPILIPTQVLLWYSIRIWWCDRVVSQRILLWSKCISQCGAPNSMHGSTRAGFNATWIGSIIKIWVLDVNPHMSLLLLSHLSYSFVWTTTRPNLSLLDRKYLALYYNLTPSHECLKHDTVRRQKSIPTLFILVFKLLFIAILLIRLIIFKYFNVAHF